MFFDGRPAGLGLVSSALSCSLVYTFTDKLFGRPEQGLLFKYCRAGGRLSWCSPSWCDKAGPWVSRSSHLNAGCSVSDWLTGFHFGSSNARYGKPVECYKKIFYNSATKDRYADRRGWPCGGTETGGRYSGRLGHLVPQRIMSLTESISPCCRQNDLTAATPASPIAALHIMQISAALNLGTYMSQSTRPGPEHHRFSNGFDHQLTHSEVSCESVDQISSVWRPC